MRARLLSLSRWRWLMSRLRRFEPGDLVRVRREPSNSTVVMPTHRACEPRDKIPADVPDLGPVCCVPVVLVRTPAGDTGGELRWVDNRDVIPVRAGDGEVCPAPP